MSEPKASALPVGVISNCRRCVNHGAGTGKIILLDDLRTSASRKTHFFDAIVRGIIPLKLATRLSSEGFSLSCGRATAPGVECTVKHTTGVGTKSSERLYIPPPHLVGQLKGQNPKDLPKTHSHTHAKAIILWKTATVKCNQSCQTQR